MNRRIWLGLIVGATVGLAALSFVDAWIVHDRVLSGEGYRDVITTVDAWDDVALPVLTAGVVVGLLTGLLAGLRLLGVDGRLRPGLLLGGSVVTLALLAATLVTVGQDGHASTIDLRPGWAAFVGAALAVFMVIAAAAITRPPRTHAIALVALAVVIVAAGAGTRWLVLQARAGSNEAWSDGSYTRAATDGLPEMTLTIRDGQFTIGDRWAGTWESSGGTVSLDDDPACPGSRGTYHAHGHPTPADEDLRFVKIVDTCNDGARAEALEAGIWERDP